MILTPLRSVPLSIHGLDSELSFLEATAMELVCQHLKNRAIAPSSETFSVDALLTAPPPALMRRRVPMAVPSNEIRPLPPTRFDFMKRRNKTKFDYLINVAPKNSASLPALQ